jgi:mono/diheme cytochrome c family protein
VTRRAGCAALLALLLACSPAGPELSEAAQRGEKVYFTTCIACHNAKPSLDALGPPLAGASRALIEARIVYGSYPPGYPPKRKSSAMPVFPNLAAKVDDLAAYLAECCPAK